MTYFSGVNRLRLFFGLVNSVKRPKRVSINRSKLHRYDHGKPNLWVATSLKSKADAFSG